LTILLGRRFRIYAGSFTTIRFNFVALGCALLAAAPRASSTRLQPAFASGLVSSFRLCLPLRIRRSSQSRACSTTMSTSAGAGAGPAYAQSRYVPAKVDSTISYDDIATFPRPGCAAPDSIAFSPNDSVVTYLASSDGSLKRQLYAMDIASGQVRELCKPPSGTGEEETFSLEEKLRRERARQLHTGITSYAWAEGAQDTGMILVPIGNELFVQEGLDGELQRLFDPAVLLPGNVPTDGNLPPILDARISADGQMVGFVWDRELYVVSTDCKSTPVQLTHGARGSELTNGLSDYIAQEEMHRYEGYWISPDSSMAAFEQVLDPHQPNPATPTPPSPTPHLPPTQPQPEVRARRQQPSWHSPRAPPESRTTPKPLRQICNVGCMSEQIEHPQPPPPQVDKSHTSKAL
jgi:hypothetical protein